MDHNYIEEQDVIERYLLGHLGAEEKERFEAHYLGCDRCFDQLELAEALIAGAKMAAAEDAARTSAAKPAKVLSFPQRFRNPLLLAAAALILLALGLPILLRQGAAVAPVSVAVLDIERGSEGASTRIDLPAKGSLVIALEVQATRPARQGTFKASLYRQNASEALWQGQDLELHQNLFSLSLPTRVVPAGEYVLLLQTSAGEEVGQYRFATREAP